MSEKRQVTVVLRAPSAAIFSSEGLEAPGHLRIERWESTVGPVTIAYRTRLVEGADGSKVAGQLWIEVVGEASSLKECVAPFANASLELLPTLALSANASIGHPDVELAFESGPGLAERAYFQHYIAPERQIPHAGRHIHMSSAIALLTAMHASPRRERLTRATNQYALALSNWRLGLETLTVAHLWMALEALTPVAIDREALRRGLSSKAELAASMAMTPRDLDTVARRDWLLAGDADCYKEAKAASDGFEHGYGSFPDMRQAATKHRRRIASLVREAIFDLAGLNAEAAAILRAPPFDQPMGHWPLATYLWGKLVGTATDLARPDSAYPFVRLKPKLVAAAPGGPSNLQFQFTPELGTGITFLPDHVEVWQPD
jgi:hypothetical protein